MGRVDPHRSRAAAGAVGTFLPIPVFFASLFHASHPCPARVTWGRVMIVRMENAGTGRRSPAPRLHAILQQSPCNMGFRSRGSRLSSTWTGAAVKPHLPSKLSSILAFSSIKNKTFRSHAPAQSALPIRSASVMPSKNSFVRRAYSCHMGSVRQEAARGQGAARSSGSSPGPDRPPSDEARPHTNFLGGTAQTIAAALPGLAFQQTGRVSRGTMRSRYFRKFPAEP